VIHKYMTNIIQLKTRHIALSVLGLFALAFVNTAAIAQTGVPLNEVFAKENTV